MLTRRDFFKVIVSFVALCFYPDCVVADVQDECGEFTFPISFGENIVMTTSERDLYHNTYIPVVRHDS